MNWNALVQRINQDVEMTMGSKRFQHTLAVRDSALEMARRFDLNPLHAEVAALLHDIAREWPVKKLISYYERAKREDRPDWEADHLALLHGPAGALWAREYYGIEQNEVLEAISFHTTGHPTMGKVAKIVYLADKIEVSRAYQGVEEVRQLALRSIDKAMQVSVDQSICYIIKQGLFLHPYTVELRNHLLKELQNYDERNTGR
ncbi:HD domain-containing protein [Heliorestis acidaminivorans]|uniref:bis(5'-nucleosyl)-tetraphosphatase (symmetrical) n=1 Tax=Heliorestis acidaminivorans TaxID=553427 RepID=A0A6I0EZF1_9FIRM|nr:bis(5'-nucleosyl)-tetraphosphatase (symmetrical) YqeK [Heliorestis acidaminivorans]KAB2952319.1 HD domain-containing protein [Heliorestis acidaminivorans]